MADSVMQKFIDAATALKQVEEKHSQAIAIIEYANREFNSEKNKIAEKLLVSQKDWHTPSVKVLQPNYAKQSNIMIIV
ncbi:MAG: hypothetical protein FWE01_02440 [Firmicutes bacterium]|nr:hypothetical protein [Bacillota bacterium]